MTENMGNKPSAYNIKVVDATSQEDIEKVCTLWQAIFPDWPVAKERMATLLTALPGFHALHEHGFCLAFLSNAGVGQIAAVAVLPEHRRQGLGTSLLSSARSQLKKAAVAAGQPDLKSLVIGSSAPRFWPQLLKDSSQGTKDFFTRAGFCKSEDADVRDLYKDIRGSIAPKAIIDRASSSKLKFVVWSPELADECLTKQRSLFTWAMAYEVLAQHEQFNQVMVAIDPETNAQVGWTLMCDSSAIASQIFAFMPLMPSGDKTGLIAAVGVDENLRGKGIGLALMVKALENLRERGVEGVFIDMVEIDGFYERLGFETKWEYESWKSKA